MNREIKFRAWDKKFNEMTQVRQIEYSYRLSKLVPAWIKGSVGVWYSPFDDQCELMQYTGLKDKNGKEIYEGDVIAIHYTKEADKIFKKDVVQWGTCDIGCNGHEYSFKVTGPYVEDEYLYGEMIEGGVSVIGNIYENPGKLGK